MGPERRQQVGGGGDVEGRFDGRVALVRWSDSEREGGDARLEQSGASAQIGGDGKKGAWPKVGQAATGAAREGDVRQEDAT